MATTGTSTPDTAAPETMLGPHPTAEQATPFFRQGQEAVVFAPLSPVKQLAERAPGATAA